MCSTTVRALATSFAAILAGRLLLLRHVGVLEKLHEGITTSNTLEAKLDERRGRSDIVRLGLRIHTLKVGAHDVAQFLQAVIAYGRTIVRHRMNLPGKQLQHASKFLSSLTEQEHPLHYRLAMISSP
jgi:hypothetical protein